MIININSWPGVGKLSVAVRLQQRIGRRPLDNHTIFNVGFSLCDFRSPEFYEAVRAVRRIAFAVAIKLPSSVPILLTSAYANTPFGRENWAAMRELANLRHQCSSEADEPRDPAAHFEEVPNAKPQKELVGLAVQLIEKKSGPFDVSKFEDHYGTAPGELVEEKRQDHTSSPKIGHQFDGSAEAQHREYRAGEGEGGAWGKRWA
jgi:hypothetical protein